MDAINPSKRADAQAGGRTGGGAGRPAGGRESGPAPPRTPPGLPRRGAGGGARSWGAHDAIVAALQRPGDDEPLIVAWGKPVALLPTHPDAPRVLISTAMVVPAWSDDAEFRRLEDAGLTMYGQMTAAAWFY